MEDGTLMQVGFEGPIVKTRMAPEERFALASILGGDPDNTQASLLREVIRVGLDNLGWNEFERVKQYADHRLHCLENCKVNVYESE